MNSSIGRRRLLKIGAAALLTPLSCISSIAREKLDSYPFALGVASGSPTNESVVLWTRLIQNFQSTPKPTSILCEVALDEQFKKIIYRKSVNTEPQFANSVHLEVGGLPPGKWVWYRFQLGDAVSPIGRTKTAPAKRSTCDQFRFAFASCQRYDAGFYGAHRRMADEDLDLVLFLGDYIYEKHPASGGIRSVKLPQAETLSQYRALYELYKSDADLQRCHTQFPWIVTWDDHEVSNDYAKDRSETLEPNFSARRAAAYQAFYEHMPLRASCRPAANGMRIYDRYDFGSLLTIHLLDDRQYRDYQIAPNAHKGGSSVIPRSTPGLAADERTILGWDQERWFQQSFASAEATWDIVAQQTLMAQHLLQDGKIWTDSWDGYPAARRRLLDIVANKQSCNPLVIGGDIHANSVAELKLDFDSASSNVVAAEVCGTSVTSPGGDWGNEKDILAANPHMRLFRSDKRGYVSVALNKKRADIKLRSVNDVTNPNSELSTLASYEVLDGKRGFS